MSGSYCVCILLQHPLYPKNNEFPDQGDFRARGLFDQHIPDLRDKPTSALYFPFLTI